MTIHLLSADHRTQGLDAVSSLGATIAHLAPDLIAFLPELRGVLVLSTCNRLGVIVDASPLAGQEPELHNRIAAFLADRAGVPVRARSASQAEADLVDHPVQDVKGSASTSTEPDEGLVVDLVAWSGHAAHAELFATAAGLESMVVGEREIAGQLRRALKVATQEGTVTADLTRVVEHASTASRRVAHETGLAGNGRSVVAVGLDLAARHLPPLSGCRVLIMGVGAYAGATVTALRERGVSDIEVYSRSGRAHSFAVGRGMRPVSDEQLPESLDLADLVITCRGLGTPVLTRDLVAPAARLRRPSGAALLGRREEPDSRAVPAERPLVVLDLSLRRDVEESVGTLPGVILIDLPDVQRAVPEAEASQVQAARDVVEQEVAAFERLQSGRRMDPLVRAMRGRVEDVVDSEIACLGVEDGKVDAAEAERALRRLAARILHHPTVAARQAGEHGRDEEYLVGLDLLLGEDVAQALREEMPVPRSHLTPQPDLTTCSCPPDLDDQGPHL